MTLPWVQADPGEPVKMGNRTLLQWSRPVYKNNLQGRQTMVNKVKETHDLATGVVDTT